MLASWETGIFSVSFTLDGQRQVVGVRLDELLELLSAANAARAEKDGGEKNGPEEVR